MTSPSVCGRRSLQPSIFLRRPPERMAERGFAPPGFVTRVIEAAGHNENDWNRRLDKPLLFLLEK